MQYTVQPIKIGRWGATNSTHKPLELESSAPAAKRTRTHAKPPVSATTSTGDRPLRKFRAVEQWLKRCLVRHAAMVARSDGRDPEHAAAGILRGAPPMVGLDIACGRGAELEYYREAGGFGHVVLVDSSAKALKRCTDRYNAKNLGSHFGLSAVNADATKSLKEKLPWRYDVVSCFRGIQYAFESEVKARTWLQNCALNLRPGGVFVGIMPDANVNTKRLQSLKSLHRENRACMTLCTTAIFRLIDS